jgi:hypothetical protein
VSLDRFKPVLMYLILHAKQSNIFSESNMKTKSYLGCLTAIIGVVASSQMAIADTEPSSNLIAKMPRGQMHRHPQGHGKHDGYQNKDKNQTNLRLPSINFPDPLVPPQQQPENNEDRPIPAFGRPPTPSSNHHATPSCNKK